MEIDAKKLAELFDAAASEAAPTTFGGISMSAMQHPSNAMFPYDENAAQAEKLQGTMCATLRAIAKVFRQASES